MRFPPYRRLGAFFLLLLLLGLPFYNWRLGAAVWLCAWIIFLLQGLFGAQRRPPTIDTDTDEQ